MCWPVRFGASGPAVSRKKEPEYRKSKTSGYQIAELTSLKIKVLGETPLPPYSRQDTAVVFAMGKRKKRLIGPYDYGTK